MSAVMPATTHANGRRGGSALLQQGVRTIIILGVSGLVVLAAIVLASTTNIASAMPMHLLPGTPAEQGGARPGSRPGAAPWAALPATSSTGGAQTAPPRASPAAGEPTSVDTATTVAGGAAGQPAGNGTTRTAAGSGTGTTQGGLLSGRNAPSLTRGLPVLERYGAWWAGLSAVAATIAYVYARSQRGRRQRALRTAAAADPFAVAADVRGAA